MLKIRKMVKLTIRKYASGCCCGAWKEKISEPLRSLGNGALKCAYSNIPRFSGFVALDVPIWPGLTDRFVLPSRRRDRSSSSSGANGNSEENEHISERC